MTHKNDGAAVPQHESFPEATAHRVTPVSVIGNVLRGALIGMAELVPGVSGGTLALITGVYERIIDSANHVVSALKTLIVGPDRAQVGAELKKVEWGMIIPLMIGMGGIALTVAGVMESFVTNQPHASRGLFLGMVAASIAVPILLIDRADLASGAQKLKAAALVVGVGAIAFSLLGFGGAATNPDPSLLLVFFAAAIAICALVLPGVSGSFFLLTIGIYAATTGAISDFNIPYILTFAAGATLGLALFVKGLHWLLHNRHTGTMLVMAGLMLGSLRALWPWQGDQRELHGIGPDALPVFGLTLLGAVVVVALVVVDAKLAKPNEVAAA